MKKPAIILIITIIILFITISIYRAKNLSENFDELSTMDFDSIGILEFTGTENLYNNKSEEFKIIKNALFELLSILRPTDYIIKRGEIKEGIDLIVHIKNGTFYKLYFGYAPSVNTILITIIDKRNFSIDKCYYLKNKDAMKFLSIRQFMQ